MERAINRRDPHALYLAAEMWSMAEPSGAVDLDVQVEAEKWSIKALAAAGQLEEAAKCAVMLFSLCAESGMQNEATHMLLLVARIQDQADNPVGQVCAHLLVMSITCVQRSTARLSDEAV